MWLGNQSLPSLLPPFTVTSNKPQLLELPPADLNVAVENHPVQYR